MARSKNARRQLARAKKAEAVEEPVAPATAAEEPVAPATAAEEVPAAASTTAVAASTSTAATAELAAVDIEVALGKKAEEDAGAADRICTAQAVPSGRDVHLESFSLSAHGHELVTDSHLKVC
jgi:hypothetical protein